MKKMKRTLGIIGKKLGMTQVFLEDGSVVPVTVVEAGPCSVIQKKIKEFVPDAPVNVMVIMVGSPKVYVVGKVMKPGMYLMDAPLRVMQVLAMAGGLNTFAKQEDIIILRNESDGQKIFPFNYNDVADGEDLEQNIRLEAGDTVVVP